MKFRKKKLKDRPSEHDQKQFIRKKIWEDPAILEELFRDKDWQNYDQEDQLQVPTSEMADKINLTLDRDKEKQRKRELRKTKVHYITNYAAASLVLMVLSFGLWHWIAVSPERHAGQKQQIKIHKTPDDWIYIKNDSTTNMELHLPDKSSVKLFAHSSIRYRRDFTSSPREVYLEGKGYFDVKKDPSRPFSVYAGETKTTALGTSFTINTRWNAKQLSVRLHSGRIVIASTAAHPAFDQVYLDQKGDNLVFNGKVHHIEQEKIAAQHVPTPRQTPTTTSLLNMENIPLSTVFTALQDTYKQSIHISDESINRILYTGHINPETESLADALSVICLINHLRYTIEHDGSYTIYLQEKEYKEENHNQNNHVSDNKSY